MKKNILLLFVSLVFNVLTVSASSCAYDIFNPRPFTFCESYSNDGNLAKIVIIASDTEENVTDFKVLELLNGDLPDTLTVKGTNGIDLNTDINSVYSIGDTLLVQNVYEYYWDEEDIDKGYYGISVCQINILEIKNGMLIGSVAPGVDEMVYEEFKTTSCSILVPVVEKQEENEVQVIPNPTDGQVEVISFENVLSYQILDVQGNIIEEGANQDWKNKEFDISNFSSGVYFLKLQTNDNSITQRIVKL
ncbi:MAG: T9SS type A sorting domain-containing protein [Cytophagales bacterium]|nr:T9SS type A sorting domain-containing protein [Cytophagales bacterium]